MVKTDCGINQLNLENYRGNKMQSIAASKSFLFSRVFGSVGLHGGDDQLAGLCMVVLELHGGYFCALYIQHKRPMQQQP